MKILYSVLALVVFGFFSNAQAPTIIWQKSYGGSNNDYARSILKTSDGGYIAAGESGSTNGYITDNHGLTDAWIVKTDASGNIVWKKSYGGSYGDWITQIIEVSDGYVFVGSTGSNNTGAATTSWHGSLDYWIGKIDFSGNIIWQQIYGGAGLEQAYTISKTLDGGYIVAGNSFSTSGDISGNHGLNDFWILKLNSLGVMEWQKAIGGSSNDEAYSIIQNPDGTYIAKGMTKSLDGQATCHGGWLICTSDFWTIKLNATGDIVWNRCVSPWTYNNVNSSKAIKIIRSSDGGYVVVGNSNANYSGVGDGRAGIDYWIVKYDSDGILLWHKSLGGSGDDYPYSVKQTLDGGYVIVGGSNSADLDITNHYGSTSYNDFWILKLDSAGTMQWQKSYGGTQDDTASDIVQNADGSFVVSGYSRSNDNDASGNNGAWDYWIVKLSAENLGNEHFNSNNTKIYPNPSKSIFNIDTNQSVKKIVLSDLNGRIMFESNSTNVIDLSSVENGIYFLKLISETDIYTKKIIKN